MEYYLFFLVINFILIFLSLPLVYILGHIWIVFGMIVLVMIIIHYFIVEDEIDDINLMNYKPLIKESNEIIAFSKKWTYYLICTSIFSTYFLLIMITLGRINLGYEIDNEISIFIVSFITFTIILIWIIFLILKYGKPFENFKFLISNENITLYLQDKIFFQVFWKDVEKIEKINQGYSKGYPSFYQGLCPLFKFSEKWRIITLNLIPLAYNRKQRTFIVALIMHFAELLNKKYEEVSEIKKLDEEETYALFKEIKEFIKQDRLLE